MKILLTGASSFTGYWFAKELRAAGHEVVTALRSSLDAYRGTRGARVEQLKGIDRIIPQCPFGSAAFLQLIQSQEWDLLCHHAADVTDYKSPDFNITQALENNTHNLTAVLHALQKQGCHRVLLTGSVFEPHEGAGSDGLRAVSPYGLSKGLTSQFFESYTSRLGMLLAKFVIPNPFGPYEEVRFTSFLIQNWADGKVAPVTHPAYVRDNIHVSLLAQAYVYFAEKVHSADSSMRSLRLNPSGYPESQGTFVRRFAEEMRSRLSLPCAFTLHHQREFPEPQVRINTDVLHNLPLHWNEATAWDELAAYYQTKYLSPVGMSA